MNYKIKSGDTLSQIALDSGTTVQALARANNITDVDFIRAGDIIEIPSIKKEKKKSSFIEKVPEITQELKEPIKSIDTNEIIAESKTKEREPKKENDNEFYTGVLPLAVRQLADDTKYDIFRKFLPKLAADKLSNLLFGEEENIKKSDFSEKEFNLLQSIVKNNLAAGKTKVDYDDYRSFGAEGISTIKDNPFDLLNNPARSLQYTFGQGDIKVADDGSIFFKDQFNFNDSKLSDQSTPYSGPDFNEQGFLKYDKDIFNPSNAFRAIRNYKTSVGRGEGEGSKTNLYLGNVNDFMANNQQIVSRQSGGITNYNQGGLMNKTQQQVKNISQQGRFGDSTLVHMNPSEVRGLSQMGQMTINPVTGLPEAFSLREALGFAAPVVGGIFGGPMGAAAASAAFTTADTGSFKKGLFAGLTSYGLGSAMQAAGAAGAAQAGTDAAQAAVTEEATKAALSDATLTNAGVSLPEGLATIGDPTNLLNPAGQLQVGNAGLLPAQTTAFAQQGFAGTGGSVPFLDGNPTLLNSTQSAFQGGFGEGLSNVAGGLMTPGAIIPAGIGVAGTTTEEFKDSEENFINQRRDAYNRRRNEMYRNNPEPILYSASGGLTQFASGGVMLEQLNARSGDFTELPQVYAPDRATYNVNPNFRPGFAPETMYFNPETINAPASQLNLAGVSPQLVDNYTGSKGGYGGPQSVASPEMIVDPFKAYTGVSPNMNMGSSTPLDTSNPAPVMPPMQDIPFPIREIPTPMPGPIVGDDFDSSLNNPNAGLTNPVEVPEMNFTVPNAPGFIDINDFIIPDLGMGGYRTYAEGGKLPNAGLEALNKVAPQAVDAMGYDNGGLTPDGQMMPTPENVDPLIAEVTQFILGESDNEEALNMFLTKYGNEAFMELRQQILESLVPNAQTEGQIAGDGNGGMDDDLMGRIGNQERIAVSQDEFIVPADVVSMLGDGSSDAGSKELYAMMDRVRQEKTGTTEQAPKLANAGGMLPV